jgi:hypothetical protein
MPFGYRPLNGDIAIDPEQAPAVVRVFQLRAGGLPTQDIASVVAREYPCCSHWKRQQVNRLLIRQDLYRMGMYRTRLGVYEQERPELVIVGATVGILSTSSKARDSIRTVQWERVADTVTTHWISLSAGISLGEVQACLAKYPNVAVTWKKARAYVPKDIARRVIEDVAASANDPVSKVNS